MAKKKTTEEQEQKPGFSIGRLLNQELSEEIQRSYLDYAMSVIVSRALPDVRDGLKPVARRILYSMWRLNLRSTAKFRKSANVVGDVMARYHPHGDTSIYDAVARLTQDFSLRYPLIEGQGNWGCFTGDMQVQLVDGRSITFRELIKEQGKGKKHWTFSFNSELGRVEIAEIKNPRLTRENAILVEVTLDNEETIRCTPDHRFMLRDGTYREAQHLKAGDSLMPLYTRLHEGSENKHLRDYAQVYQAVKRTWDFVHHLADQWNLTHEVYDRAQGRVRHHKDFNKKNNNPDNIQRMHWGEHWKLHAKLASWRHKHDQEYVEKLAKGREKYIENNRDVLSQRTSERNKKMWKDPIYREAQIMRLKTMWENEEYREFMREQSSANLKRLWQNPEFQVLMSQHKSEEMKKRWKNTAYRSKMSRHMEELSQRIWSNPAHRELISRRMKEISAQPLWRQRLRAMAKALWRDPEYRAKYPKDHFSKMAKKLWEDENTKIQHSRKAKLQWKDQQFRAKLAQAVTESNKRRLIDNPAMMKELAKRSAVSLQERWQSEHYKERVIRSKILRHVKKLVEKHGVVTPEIYERERVANGVPKLSNALQYFENFDEIVEAAKHYNHSVISVRFLTDREDVYDITVDPWHNFALAAGVFVHNSIDGDKPAAMRYTEARLAKVADEIMVDIEKETVNFADNYDGTRTEPVVLPSRLPQFLVNGTVGIAVGMATNVPPHNVSEVAKASMHLIDNPEATVEDLVKFVQGPDFPTGGAIYNKQEILQAYATGKGSIVTRALADIEEDAKGGHRIIVREIPYLVNKAALLTRIADGVKAGRLEGIRDLRDESDKDGVRIVIELKKDAYPKKVLNQLFVATDLQKTFHVNMLALVEGGRQPKILGLKEVLQEHITHRREVITRRTQYDVNRAKERAHILEGLKKALDHIDEVIAAIKKSRSRETAHQNLRKEFTLSDAQATAILEMRLQTLSGLERQKVEDELKEKKKLIKELEDILADPKKVLAIIKGDFEAIVQQYGDERRTRVFAQAVGDFSQEDLVPDDPTVVTITRGGYIKRLAINTYHVQHRGGKGVRGMTTKEEDVVDIFLATTTHKELLFFTNLGRVFAARAYEIPATTRTAKGQALQNFLELGPQEKVTAMQALPADEDSGEYLVMTTRHGHIKKTSRRDFQNIRRSGLKAITLKKSDALEWVAVSSGQDEVIIITKQGQAIRFVEKDVRSMGRTAAGVIGMRLKGQDEVVAMHVIDPSKSKQQEVLVVTEQGFGKRTPLAEYRRQKRGGSGIKTASITGKTGQVVNAALVDADTVKHTDLLIISEKGQVIRVPADTISKQGRSTQGVRVMRPSDKSGVVATFTPWTEVDEE